MAAPAGWRRPHPQVPADPPNAQPAETSASVAAVFHIDGNLLLSGSMYIRRLMSCSVCLPIPPMHALMASSDTERSAVLSSSTVPPDVPGTRFQHPRVIPGAGLVGGGLVAAPPAVLAAVVGAHQPPAHPAPLEQGGAPADGGQAAVALDDGPPDITHMAHRSAILTYACRPVAST